MKKLSILLLLPILFISILVRAEPSQKDLQAIQSAIAQNEQALQNKQAIQRKIARNIRSINRQIQQKNNEIQLAQQDKNNAITHLEAMRQNLDKLQVQVKNMQAQVARLLNAQYRTPQPNALILLLQNTDPHLKMRELTYIRYIQQANITVFNQLTEQKNALKQQSDEINNQILAIEQAISKSDEEMSELQKQKLVQQKNANSLSSEIQAYRNKVNALHSDEKRITELLQQISARKVAQAKQQANIANSQGNSKPVYYFSSDEKQKGFSRLQGTLRLPVSGKIEGRFGQSKSDGSVWNGIFIATPPQPVAAMAGGVVGYTGAMRGYGNIIIINHEGNYLTIYTGLSNINVRQGSRIKARQIIGVSGSIPNNGNGLYFEIRYQNTPINPSSWLKY